MQITLSFFAFPSVKKYVFAIYLIWFEFMIWVEFIYTFCGSVTVIKICQPDYVEPGASLGQTSPIQLVFTLTSENLTSSHHTPPIPPTMNKQ